MSTSTQVQVVIPMSGLGSRFVRAGYAEPKPLIEVNGHPIVEWVLRVFPGERDVTFICRDEHLRTTRMREVLTRLSPEGRIVEIAGHKLGPVYALLQGAAAIDDARPVMVSYCDYYLQWDYPAFRREVLARGCDGAIPCYTGFHPHLLHEANLYASCLVDGEGRLREIREKYCGTADKTQALHSPGVYYFRTGALLKRYCEKMLAEGPALNGEYYVSLMYNHMVRDGLTVHVPANVTRFCQWGTPEDLAEYRFWVEMVRGFAR